LNQNDTRRANQTDNVTGLERESGTPARQQQPHQHPHMHDHSKATKPSTQNKYGLFLEDAPFLEVLDLMKAQMKLCIDKKLFWNIKFYDSQEDIQNVVDYVFQDISMDGNSIREKLERTQVWSAACYYISFQTCELRQQAFECWYASCGK